MKRGVLTLMCVLFTFLAWSENDNNSFLKRYMEENSVNGTVVIESLNLHKTHVYNDKRSKVRFLPASTFKIINTLISLQERVVKDENEVIKWDGQDRGMADWNRDQNMKSAFQISCVWFYQELARRVGKDVFVSYLKKMNYGNSKTGERFDSFWLDGDLRISAIEQIEVLKNIYKEKYAFDSKNYEILKTLMIVDKNENYVVRAKTGIAVSVSPNIGWYVGYIETKDDVNFFACNIDLMKPEQIKMRKEIVYAALRELKIIN